ncbi:ACP S-malonyltransferase [Streptomyces sp. NPDC051896]|uniref:ACP S-malonyltransferase n=1 Tax=Streptomyces sp. NPDC051896 TaxID=3155416 RepID=UPI003446A017
MLSKSARALVAEASDILGYHLLDRYKEEDGRFTASSRVSFLVGCLALARDAELRSELRPDVVVGPSFGGMPAAAYAGAVGFADAVRMTAGWGDRVDRYFAEHYSDTVSQSCARLPEEELAEVLVQLRADGEWHDVACYVDTDFAIVSVRERRLPWLVEQMRARGGLPLATMRPPMHSPSFAALREEVAAEVFARLEFSDPVLPMVDDHDGGAVHTAGQVREMVLDGITAPVRWPSVVATLRERGVRELVVAGQDSLWGRVRCSTDNFAVTTLTPRRALVPPARRLPAGAG